MEYKRAVAVNRVQVIKDGASYHVVAIICPECEQYNLNFLTSGLMYCPGCDSYFELGIYKIER